MNDCRQTILSIGRKIYDKGYVAATEGNLSCRLSDGSILATASGVCKGDLTEKDLVQLDTDGLPLDGGTLPSTEIGLHLEVYRIRPDVNAVIHAHPPYSVSLTLAGLTLDKPYLPETVLLLGAVPTAPYARPSTTQVAESIRPFIPRTDTILLERHGSLTAGRSLMEAFRKLEVLEHSAKITWLAKQVRHYLPLEAREITELMKLRKSTYGLDFPIIPFR